MAMSTGRTVTGQIYKVAQAWKAAHLLASIAVVGVGSLLGRPDRFGQLVNQLQADNECGPKES